MVRRIAITGATGFLGVTLARHFAADERWRVRLLARRSPPPIDSVHPIEAQPYNLEQPVDASMLGGCDVIVHCAHDLTARARGVENNVNYSAAQALIQANEDGPRARLIFVSTLSAHEDSQSEYGRVKYATEQLIDCERHTVLRPGLIIGDGGLFRRMLTQLQSAPCVPLFYFGRRNLQTIWIGDLVKAIELVIAKRADGLIPLCHPEPVGLGDFYASLLVFLNRRVPLIPLPGEPFYWSLRVAEAIGLRLPFSSDNVLGVKHLRCVNPRSALDRLGLDVSDLQTSLQRLAAART